MNQREQLQNDIASLQAKKEKLEEKLKNTFEGTNERNELSNELASTIDKMKAKQAELDQIDNAASTAQAEVSSQFENITFGDQTIDLRSLCNGEEGYQLVSEFIQRTVGDLAEKHATLISSFQSEIQSLEDEIIELESSKAEVDRLGMLLADMTAKREAAADELDNAKEEVKRLTADNESLRKQLTEKPVNKTNVDAAELIKKLLAAKPGIYNKRWKMKDNGMEDRRFFTAELSETGETIDIAMLDIGKYREESAEDAERFRQTKAAEEAEKLANETVDVVVPSLEKEPAVQAEPADGAMVQEPVSRAEYEALRHEVTMIAVELKARNILPMNWEAVA